MTTLHWILLGYYLLIGAGLVLLILHTPAKAYLSDLSDKIADMLWEKYQDRKRSRA